MSGRDKWVRRFSVDETARHKNGFTIYKITSVLFPRESPEAVTVVCVWKRYSEVRRLRGRLLALLGAGGAGGAVPLPSDNYFRRFQREVIEERARAIKRVLEFIAEHRLLFTSAEFVNFLQSGYPPPGSASPAPAPAPAGVIATIRAALQLPPEHAAPLEYTSDDSRSATPHPTDSGRDETDRATIPQIPAYEIDRATIPQIPAYETDRAAIPQIPIYEAANVEIKHPSLTASFDSLASLESLNDDLYDELNKLNVEKKSAVKKKMLPDLINFDAPSSSRFDDYHTMKRDDESLNSTSSRSSLYGKSVSLSNAGCASETEDGYVFEAGYMLNLAARCEDAGDYRRAFECYKCGIEKMLVGVQTDTDPQRRALIKEKTNKYLSYAEQIYKNHLSEQQETLVLSPQPARQWSVPASMLRRPYAELGSYRVLAVLGHCVLLVLRAKSECYAMKVIQKIPNNLTEFDEYFHQRTNETRQPILPTNIPYMVPLQAYIETNNLIFLILTYAPGEKLFDYIRNYVNSAPTTPARELNLDNVFNEPLKKDMSSVKFIDDDSVNDDDVEVLVKNSQQLLQNVDKVLRVDRGGDDSEQGGENEGGKGEETGRGGESPAHCRLAATVRNVIPPSVIRNWGAQILTALESLHNAGVICRDLNPSNILLGSGGQALLTYVPGYSGDVCCGRLWRDVRAGGAAPELYQCGRHDHTCDYWSFGAIMYELLCGVPLSHHHSGVFTRHTLLVLPEELPVEQESLLTQLLAADPAERLGRGGVAHIQQHPYFRHVDWTSLPDAWLVPG